MAKPNPLASALSTAAPAVRQVSPAVPVTTPTQDVRPAQTLSRHGRRPGRVMIGGHFAPEVQRMIKVMAAEEGTTIQDLMAEALNDLFAKRGKPQIAALTPKIDQ